MSGFCVKVDPGRSRVLSGDLGAWDIVEASDGFDVVRGVHRGKAGLLSICTEVLRRNGAAAVYFANWNNTGGELARQLPWFEACARPLVVALRRTIAVRQAAFCARCQEVWGGRAVREADAHCEVAVLVGAGGWVCTVRGSIGLVEMKEVEWFEIDWRPEVARAHVAWFDGLRSFGTILGERVKQRTFLELVSKEWG